MGRDTNLCESRPHFFCIGPGSSGTTWIADHLKLQRDVWLPPIQELGYLNAGFEGFRDTKHLDLAWDWWNVVKRVVRNKGFSLKHDQQFYAYARQLAEVPNSERDLELYRKLFEPAGERITGDITPSYAELEVEQIKRFSPVLRRAKVFMIARDPVERFWSAVSMYWRDKVFGDVDYGSFDFIRSVFREQEKQNFLSQIAARWREGLGEHRVQIFYFDDLTERPAHFYKEMVAFIGADPKKRIPMISTAYNRKAGQPKIEVCPEVRQWVRDAFANELRACAKLFGEHGERWRRRHEQTLRGPALLPR
ncbi:sulfotransferase [Sphingomonas daechungensis]|uniref:sulfotransferase n=1 Tax=Sphingomonas daechungensis TaxID=1176646 RepID=UPI0037839395